MFALSQPPRAPHAKPRTFDETRNLPRLPIPTLDASLDKYLTSLRPFLAETEGGQVGVERALERRRVMARQFKQSGLGDRLQGRLKGLSYSSSFGIAAMSSWD